MIRAILRCRCVAALIVCGMTAATFPAHALGEPSVDELLLQLASEDSEVRSKTAEVLAKIKPLPDEAISPLLAALDDRTPHSMIKIYAAWALGNGGPKAGQALMPRLLEKLRARNMSSEDINEIHSLHEAAVPALLELLKDPEPRQRVRSLGILTTMADRARSAGTAVHASLDDPDLNTRLAAAYCSFVLTGDTVETVPVLITGLKTSIGKSATWCEAAQALGSIGPPAKAAVPQLIEILQGSREVRDPRKIFVGSSFPWFHVRAIAAAALGQIGPDAKAAVPALIAATQQIDDGDNSAAALRVRAARALWRIAPDHPEALPAVLRGLNESNPLNRITIDTVILIGPPAKDAVPDLITALASDRLDTRQSAIDALGMIGAPASAAIPALQKLAMLKELKDLHFAEHAQLAIARIGPPERSVVPLLTVVAKSVGEVELRQILQKRLAVQK